MLDHAGLLARDPLPCRGMARAIISSLLVVILWPVLAVAAPPVPSGAHPRIWLDGETLAHLRAEAKRPQSATARAIAGCDRVRREPSQHLVDQYQGFTFSEHLQNCALAWQVTGKKEYAETALIYFRALLDDYKKVGAGDGGDDVVRHDSGYAVRMFGPNAALGYDWLYDAPGMTEALRAHARARFSAWMDWYQAEGYLADKPGANFQAGYVYAATLIAIAQGAEAGAAGTALWQRVVETVFGKEMLPAMASGGILHGGDWPEGWQYGALSVLEYALAMRALQEQGVALAGAEQWGEQLMRRYLHGLTPTGAMFVGGDTQIEAPHLEPSVYPLLAVLVGPATEAARSWARATKQALEVHEEQYPLYEALADASRGSVTSPLSHEPTYYFASGTQTFYVRSSWSAKAAWAVVQCTPRRRDHQHLNAGNVLLSRGADAVLVDPSPYDSLSSLTSNAPTVVSKNLPENYQPSQAPWGEQTRLTSAGQTASGVAVVQCDYADQYRFKETQPDVLAARRDVVFVPWNDGASLVIIDQTRTRDSSQPLQMRFRTAAPLRANGNAARGHVGSTQVGIGRLWASSNARARIAPVTVGNCYGGVARGQCAAARFLVHEYSVEVPGPQAALAHVVDASATGPLAPISTREGAGYRVALLERGGETTAVVVPEGPAAQLTYQAPRRARHVVLHPSGGTFASATGSADGKQCRISVRAGAARTLAEPLVLNVSESCVVTVEEPRRASPVEDSMFAKAADTPPGASGRAATRQSPAPSFTAVQPSPRGCGCAAGTSDAASMGGGLLGLMWLLRRRLRRDRFQRYRRC